MTAIDKAPMIRVLVVDDNEVNRYTVARILSREKFDVSEAATGTKALELAMLDPDVIVLDVRLPDIDGIEVCRRLKADPRTSAIPILHLSATYKRSEDRALGLESGADGYLNHPVDPRELTAHVTALARVRRAEREKQELLERERAAREAAEEARCYADRANRAKDEFLAALSHELRTPLTPVLMAASELESDPALPEKVRSVLTVIRQNAELEARLIDDLLDLTRIARGKLTLHTKVVDAHSVVRAAVEVCMSDSQAKGQKLHLKLEAGEHYVEADPVRLQQVFWNVIKNSVKFTPYGGSIEVRSSSGDGKLNVDVMDNGVGIAPEVLPRIFGIFEQGGRAVTHQFGGLGLGLAISQAIVKMHHGRLTATSEGVGKGAAFTVTLATAETPDLAADSISPADAGVNEPLHGLRLLLVEDHESTRYTMQRILTAWGCRVLAAPSVAAAKAVAASNPIDLVISDLGLPDGSGLELMQHLASTHGLRGLCLSGYGMEDDVRKSREAGFVHHLTKPVSFDHLRAALVQWATPRSETASPASS